MYAQLYMYICIYTYVSVFTILYMLVCRSAIYYKDSHLDIQFSYIVNTTSLSIHKYIHLCLSIYRHICVHPASFAGRPAQSLTGSLMPRKRDRKVVFENDNFEGNCDQDMEAKVRQWQQWRALAPTRAPKPIRKPEVRPAQKSSQQAWHLYGNRETQQHFMPRFSSPTSGATTQSLTGAPPEANLFKYIDSKTTEEKEHYTNIHRVQHLATGHPLVQNVEQIKTEKALDPSLFRDDGRCIKYHQSPWDLKLTLAASGAQMIVGVTVNNVAASLLAGWWQPSGSNSTQQLELMEAIFLDIMEADHVQPAHIAQRLWEKSAAATSGLSLFRTRQQPPLLMPTVAVP